MGTSRRRRDSGDDEDDDVQGLKNRIRCLERELRDAEGNKKVKSVFDTSPRNVDEDTFELLYPFFTRVMNDIPAYNHVSFLEDRSKVFEEAGAYVLARVQEHIETFGKSQNEHEDRYHMIKLLEALGSMTVPESVKGRALKVALGPVEYEVTEADISSSSSEEDLKLNVEEETACKKTWRMDIGCSIINRKMLEEIQQRRARGNWDADLKWLLRLVIECKEGTITDRDMHQAIMCIVSHVKDRFIKDIPIDPVYAQVWSPSCWRYGLVDVQGFVQVKGGKLVKSSLQEFEVGLQKRIARRGAKEDVARHVNSATIQDIFSEFAKRLMRSHGCSYRDGWYPVGTLYICDEDFRFPRLQRGPSAMEDEDAKRFFQALVRILLGNKMLSRDSEHLLSVVSNRSLMKSKSNCPLRPELTMFLRRMYEAANTGLFMDEA